MSSILLVSTLSGRSIENFYRLLRRLTRTCALLSARFKPSASSSRLKEDSLLFRLSSLLCLRCGFSRLTGRCLFEPSLDSWIGPKFRNIECEVFAVPCTPPLLTTGASLRSD